MQTKERLSLLEEEVRLYVFFLSLCQTDTVFPRGGHEDEGPIPGTGLDY